MFKAAVVVLVIFLASALPANRNPDDLQPVCVCPACKPNAIGGERQALLIGEAYVRALFGERAFSTYKPLRAFRMERSNGGAFWAVVGLNSKRPEAIDGIQVLLDANNGCLLSAGYDG